MVGDEPDVPALAAIAAVRTAEGHRPLPPERHAARATVAAAHVELALVDELGGHAQSVKGSLRNELGAYVTSVVRVGSSRRCGYLPPMQARFAGALVFVASGSVLVLEILAGRLLAPYVGVSLETFTGVVGVVLAGIATGTWTGG